MTANTPATMTAAAEPRTLCYDPSCRLLTMKIKGRVFAYWLDTIRHSLGADTLGVRLSKIDLTGKDEPEAYDVYCTPADGHGRCTCESFRFSRRQVAVCKHIDSVLACRKAGKI